MTAELDPLRDEGLEYAGRLSAAGVSVELHQYTRVPHAFDLSPARRRQGNIFRSSKRRQRIP
jgi:acetyl esterase/lipase